VCAPLAAAALGTEDIAAEDEAGSAAAKGSAAITNTTDGRTKRFMEEEI
jgi:hypothetical protein